MAENDEPGINVHDISKKSVPEKIVEPAILNTPPENILPNQETEIMEVHAHHLHRAPGKKFWHFFFEFLMLFLAIFCGFLAENWREKLQEHRREKEFIHSIVEDIRSDTLQSNQVLMKLRKISTGIDSVLIALSSSEVIRNSNNAYRLWNNILGLDVFVSNDRTIEQLKNSGELRLIRKKDVSDRIMKYDQILKKYYVQSDLMYNALREMTIYRQLFDFIRLDKNNNSPIPLTPEGTKLVNQAYANLQLWNKGLIGLISWLQDVHEEGVSLIAFIQEEYELE
jgi:hypothetical protein